MSNFLQLIAVSKPKVGCTPNVHFTFFEVLNMSVKRGGKVE